jgi:hypothetical protein
MEEGDLCGKIYKPNRKEEELGHLKSQISW